MSTRTLISVEEYLASSYEPDCDYVDGQLEERNLGERYHARFQARLVIYLSSRFEKEGMEVLPEVRVQVKPTRFRVPDICAARADSDESVLTKPPFLCIEILSSEDGMSRIERRINDYLEMGVSYVWVLDPETKQVYIATPVEGLREVEGKVLRTENPVIELPLDEVLR